jgi:tagatose 6-phosphate kinase
MVFDRVQADGVNRAAEVRDYASGKSVNVAKVLRALGEDALATGFVGGDRGEALCRDLDAMGVRHAFVTVTAPTRQCVTVIDRSAGTATELVEESHAVEPGDWGRLAETIRPLLARATACVFSGSLPPGAPQDFYARWLPSATGRGIPVLIDARGEPLSAALQHPGFIAKLNRDELAATVGCDIGDERQLRAAMREVLPAGGALVVTHGGEGAWATHEGQFWRVRPPKVTVSSAVGSGDAFAAGLMAGLTRGEAWPRALARAAACGAANATNPVSGHVRAEDVEGLVPQAVVEVVEE